MKLESNTIKDTTKSAGGNEQLFYQMINKLRLWLQYQHHLPQEITDKQLARTIISSKFNMEKAKKRLDSLYTLRTLLPEFFGNYSPLANDIIENLKQIHWTPLPKLTPDKCRVTFIKVLESDVSLFSMESMTKYAFMTLDARIDEEMVAFDIAICDCANIIFRHITKCTPVVLKKIDLILEAYGLRYKAIYLINAPSYIEQLMKLVRLVMKPKIYERIEIYTTGIESVYEHIPKSILPADYGGEEPSLDTLTGMWQNKLVERKDWLIELEKLKTDESLRTNCVINPDDLFGVAGTFRKLDID